MDGQDAAVSEMVAVSGCTPEQAQFLLEANAGDQQAALSMYYEQMQMQERPPPRAPAAAPAPAPTADRPAGAPAQNPAAPADPRNNNVWLRAARGPFGILRVTFRLVFRTLGLGWGVVSFIGHQILPPPVIRFLRNAFRSLLPSTGEALEPEVAAARFISEFREAYGAECCPQWQECSWQEAANRAHREFKFLFVYIHNTEAQETNDFCKNVLCNPEFVEFLNDHFVAWGGNRKYSDALTLSKSLRASRYPYVALLIGNRSRLRLACAIDGNSFGPVALKERLLAAVDSHGAELVVQRTEARERDMSRMIREQQDLEYQESLEQDRLREEALAEERRAAEEAQRAADEEEARIRAAAEAEEQRQRDFVSSLENRRNKALAVVTPEPEKGEAGACPLRIRLPDGAILQRRFLSSDKVQSLYDYVDSQEGFEVLSYNLVSNFPHCVYNDEKRSMTIQEAGLAGAMLLIQSLDD